MTQSQGESPKKKGRRDQLSPSQLSIFCTQISLILRSGVTLTEGLSLMEADLEKGQLQSVVKILADQIADRVDFKTALEASGAFPPYFVRMAGIGEVSGNLDEMMYALSRYYEREKALRQRIHNSLTYPIVLLCMMTAVILLLIIQVLPMFSDILESLGGQMPPVVQGLMGFGSFVGNNLLIIALVIVALIVLYMLFRRTEAGAAAIDRFKARFPLTRGLMGKIVAERFATAMSFLLKSDIDMDNSLSMASDILGNRYMAAKIDGMREIAARGESVYDAIYQVGIFPKLFTRMLSIGQKTGDLDSMMERLADIYEQEVDASLKRLTGIIEPIFVAILSVIVGIILISVMLPLINIMTSIG